MKWSSRLLQNLPLFLLALTVLLPVSVCMADGTAVIVEVCTNETDVSVYVKNAGDNFADVSAQIGTSACSQVTCENIGGTAFETLILIDNSLSIPKEMRSRTSEFLRAFVEAKAQNEQIAVGVFSRNITYLTDFTSDSKVLKEAVDAVSYQNQDTYITDMLYDLWRDSYVDSRRDVYRRIVIIADGVDDESLGYTVDELRQLIEKESYPIYTIGCRTGSNNSELENLFSLSRQSNAEYFLMDSSEDITTVVDALGRDREIARVVVAPPADLLDGSMKSVKINFSGQSVSKEMRMPQPETAQMPVPETMMESSVEENFVEESSEEENFVEEETSVVDEEALRKADAKRFIRIVIAVWAAIIAGFITFIMVLRFRKKQKREIENTQNVMDQRREQLRSALPQGERYVILTDVHAPEKCFQASLSSEVVVGRSAGQCSILLNYNQSVSGRHCVIYRSESNQVMIRDLGSTNGTFVNGHRISDATGLKPGDSIIVGQLEMRVDMINC